MFSVFLRRRLTALAWLRRRKGNKFTEIPLLIWIINQRRIFHLKRWLLTTIRHYSPLFVTVRHYSHYSRLFALFRTIRYSLFAIRYSGFPDTLEPAVERLNVHYRSFSKFINSLKWIESHKTVWRKRYITSSYLLMSTFLLFLILNLLQRIQSSHKTCIKAEVIRCVKAHGKANLKRGGRGWRGRKPHSVTSYNCYLFV